MSVWRPFEIFVYGIFSLWTFFFVFLLQTHQNYRVFNLHFNSKVKVPIPIPVWFTFFYCGFLCVCFFHSLRLKNMCGQILLCQLLIQLVYMRSTRIAATTNLCVNAKTYDCISKTLSVCFLCVVFFRSVSLHLSLSLSAALFQLHNKILIVIVICLPILKLDIFNCFINDCIRGDPKPYTSHQWIVFQYDSQFCGWISNIKLIRIYRNLLMNR